MKNSLWKQIIDAPLQVIQFLAGLLGSLLSAPFRLISRPGSGRGSWGHYGRDERETSAKSGSLVQRMLASGTRFVNLIFKSTGQLLAFPVRFGAHLFVKSRKELWWCLPAISVSLLLAFVLIRVGLQEGQILRKYRLGAGRAMQDGEFELAKTYTQRVVSWPGIVRDADRLNWALCLLQTGEVDSGTRVLNELAPDDKAGYPPAHRFKALMLSQRLSQSDQKELLEPLRHHLTHSSDGGSEELQVAWAVYYVKTEQPEKAIPYLQKAAKKNPRHHFAVAKICGDLNDEASRLAALREAERRFRILLDQDPVSHPVRIACAQAIVEQGRTDEAEQLLVRGLSLKDDATIRRALAAVMLDLYDESTDFDEQLSLLQRSLNFDLNYFPTYQRLIQQFEKYLATDPEEADRIEEMMMSSIASGNATALAHFAISNLFALKGQPEDSKWHLEAALELDSRFIVVANNLAWMLAHDEDNPDLDRAFELAEYVVERAPDNPRMRDTFATVLMKQEKWNEARVQFEMILGTIVDPIPVHQKLAIVYDQLDRPRLAEEHRKIAAKLQQAAEKS